MRLPKPKKQVRLDEYVARAGELAALAGRGQERVVIEENGTPAAALISARDLEWIEFFEKGWDERSKALEASWAAFRGVPSDEIEREVAKAISEVREEMRRQRRGHAESA